MAVDKGKVKAALDAKFKGKSVSKELKEAYAARWADRIEDESGIEEYINDRAEDVLDAAKEADRRSQAAATKARQDAADAAAGKKTEGEEKPNEAEEDPNEPTWAKNLRKQNEALQARLDGFQQQQQTKTIAERFNTDDRVKKIPEFMRVGYVPTSEEEYEAKVEALTAGFSNFAEQNKLAGFGQDMPPAGGATGKPGAVKPASKEEIDATMALIG